MIRSRYDVLFALAEELEKENADLKKEIEVVVDNNENLSEKLDDARLIIADLFEKQKQSNRQQKF